MYANTPNARQLNVRKSAPIIKAIIVKIIPPASWEIPVIQKGELLDAIFLVKIFPATVQTDAKTIKMSPNEKDIPSGLKLIAIIPKKPTIAPTIFQMLKVSPLINKKAKHTYKSEPNCLIKAVLELSVVLIPMYKNA